MNVVGVGRGEGINKISTIHTGILRYVGIIRRKEGIFCGIELLDVPGKHDGSYEGMRDMTIIVQSAHTGIAYFHCPDGRGIFAPPYKISIDGDVTPTKTPPQMEVSSVFPTSLLFLCLLQLASVRVGVPLSAESDTLKIYTGERGGGQLLADSHCLFLYTYSTLSIVQTWMKPTASPSVYPSGHLFLSLFHRLFALVITCF